MLFFYLVLNKNGDFAGMWLRSWRLGLKTVSRRTDASPRLSLTSAELLSCLGLVSVLWHQRLGLASISPWSRLRRPSAHVHNKIYLLTSKSTGSVILPSFSSASVPPPEPVESITAAVPKPAKLFTFMKSSTSKSLSRSSCNKRAANSCRFDTSTIAVFC